jgi:hypothetical protein
MTKKFVSGLLVLSSFGFGLLLAADPFAGNWKLNAKKSTFVTGWELKELTVSAVDQGDNAMVTVRGKDGGGKPISIRYTLPLKGGNVNYIEGVPAAGLTEVAKRVDANTIDTIASLSGQQVATSHAVLSADGKTITMTRTNVNAKGITVKGNVEIYERQ